MKKTLLITHEYYPYRGGIARYCFHLFSHLPSASYLVASDQRERDRRVSIIPTKFTSLFIRPRWLKGVREVQKLVKQHGIEQIMTPSILPLGAIALQVFRSMKVPYIVSLHGLDINLALQNKRTSTLSILKNARHIITNSEATRRILLPLKLKTPVSVITPYLDPDRLSVDETTARSILQTYGTKRIILTVGRLVKRKGQDMVIKALPLVRKRVPNVHYCIIGSGPGKAYLEQCIREAGVVKHVSILTDVPDSELGAYYSHASLFAMPTRKLGPDVEGFGIVYLEAAYFRLPILAGKTGGEAEAIGSDDAGLFVDGDDVDEIAECIVHLLEDRELAHFLGRNARTHLDGIPHWDQQAIQLQRILS